MAQEMDLVDIEENLKYRSANVQCQAFTSLATKIFDENPDEKLEKPHHKVFFDCWFAFGDVPFEMLMDALPVLREKRFVTEETRKEHFNTVFDAFSARITRIDRIQRAFSSFVDVFHPNHSNFLLLCSKIPQDAVFDVCSDASFYSRNLQRIVVLLFTDILSPNQKRQLGNDQRIQGLFLPYFPKLYPQWLKTVFEPEQFLRVCSEEELKEHSLEGLDIFQRLKLVQERQHLLSSLKLKAHALYLPYLLEMNTYRKELLPTVQPDRLKVEFLVLEVRTIISAAQEQIHMINPNFTLDLNLETWLGHVINNEKIPTFVRFIEHFPDCVKMLQKPNCMPLLTVLLIHTRDEELQKRICKILVNFVSQVPRQADGYVRYFVTLTSNPFFPIPKQLVVETLTDLAVNRFQNVLHCIVNYLSRLAHKGQFRVLGLKNLVKVVRKYPTIVGSLEEVLLDFTDQGDSQEVFEAKLNLAKECCIATDDNDKLLSGISKLLNGSGSRLASTIDVILELVKNDVLELKQVRKQLSKKVALPGNEHALIAYCRLLALGAIPNSEETEEANNELKLDCIKELYEFTKHQKSLVVSESWRSLGDFDVVDIEEAVTLTPSTFGAKYIEFRDDEQEGFVDFLQKVISREVDSYQRPLYNIGAQVQAENPPLLTKIDTYKDQLMVKNKDAVWFWSATLPLCGPILQLATPSNKVLQAVRLVKSCLLNVPQSTSNEDMLRLMAGWRICVREAFQVLADSKNNDLLWARDQITQEGRICLTQKSESVDNIMMMLTVLAEVVEEKLRVIDDQKLIDEVSKAQKPWVISVFEFIATRLPKDVKQRREPKCNPIYQVLTHSNKSSLFIAIFCTRLLYRNPSILEFYGDVAELELVQDRLFDSLLQDSSLELKPEEVPNRKMLWITTEAYGADEMTAKAFEATYQVIINDKTEDVGEPILENDVEVFFKALTSSPKDVISEAQQKSRKLLEKLWNNGSEDQKRKIYEGLAELALISGSCQKRAKTIPIDKLPDSSVLKGVLSIFDEKHNVEVEKLRKLLRSLAGHKRQDGRFLPPVDWLRILKRVNWQDSEASRRLPIVTLACEQNISEVLFHVAPQLTTPEILVLAEHLGSVSKLLPRNQFEEVLRQLIRHARSEKNPDETLLISESIAANQKLPIVRLLLAKSLPTLESTIEVTDPILEALKDPEDFGGGLISSCFDVWLEAKNGERMNIKRICDTISGEDVEKRVLFYGLVSHEARKLSIRKRFEKILDVITVSRISRSTGTDLTFFLPLILSLIVSPTDDVDIPVCWFDNEDVLEQIMISAARPFFKVLIQHEEMKCNVKHIASFLRPYIEGEEATMYVQWQRSAARDSLLHLIASYPQDAIPDMLHEPDTFWKALLPV